MAEEAERDLGRSCPTCVSGIQRSASFHIHSIIGFRDAFYTLETFVIRRVVVIAR